LKKCSHNVAENPATTAVRGPTKELPPGLLIVTSAPLF
jgi:hypothetical protein